MNAETGADSSEWPTKAPAPTVTQTLDRLLAAHDGAQLIELVTRLGNLVSVGVELPVAELVEGTADHGWTPLEVRCPHCQKTRPLTELEILDHAHRRSQAIHYDTSTGHISFDRDGTGTYQALHLLMGCCGRPVTLPPGIQATPV